MPVGATGMSLSDAISGYTAGLSGNADKEVKGLEQAKDTYEDRIKSADTEEKGLDPSALKPPALSPPPQPQATQPIQVWGSAAMWMAALGGILTRQPFTNSLKAAGAVMNSYKQADASAAQQAYDSWKTETENATKMAQFSIDAYKTALSKIDSDKKQAASDFTTTAKALGDENAAYVATHYGIDAAVHYVDSMQAHVDRMKEAQPKIDLQNEQLQLGTKLLTAGRALQAAQKTGDPAKIKQATVAFQSAQNDSQNFAAGTGKNTTQTSFDPGDPGDKSYIDAVANYKVAPPSSGRNPAQRKALLEQVLKVNPDYQEARYQEAQKAMRDFGTGKQGDLVRSLNVAVTHLETLRGLSEALKNGDVQKFNQLAQAWAEQTGNPAPTNFDAAKVIVGDEVVKGIVGGQNAQSDREKSQEAFNKARSPDQLLGAIQTVVEPLMAGQLKGLKGQYERTTGSKDFDQSFLSEDTRNTLERNSGSGADQKAKRGPAQAHQGGKPIWPEGDHWVYEDGTTVK